MGLYRVRQRCFELDLLDADRWHSQKHAEHEKGCAWCEWIEDPKAVRLVVTWLTEQGFKVRRFDDDRVVIAALGHPFKNKQGVVWTSEVVTLYLLVTGRPNPKPRALVRPSQAKSKLPNPSS